MLLSPRFSPAGAFAKSTLSPVAFAVALGPQESAWNTSKGTRKKEAESEGPKKWEGSQEAIVFNSIY